MRASKPPGASAVFAFQLRVIGEMNRICKKESGKNESDICNASALRRICAGVHGIMYSSVYYVYSHG